MVFPGRVTLSSCSGSRTHQLIDSFRISRRLDAIKSSWQTLNRNVAALEDRGHVFCFEPSPLEVHRRTATWFWDQEIFDFLGAPLPWVREASRRHYLAARPPVRILALSASLVEQVFGEPLRRLRLRPLPGPAPWPYSA